MPNSNDFISACKQKGCTISTDRKCLEGLTIENCPHHFYLESEGSNIDAIKSKKEVESKKNISLFSGVALDSLDVSLITNEFECKRIFIIGESGCGKTTLLASIFDMFQRSTIGDIYFAGSFTQLAFEERCHLSRILSDAAMPETEKTSSKEFNFLHLSVKHGDNLKSKPVHLLISDIAGERLRLARDSSSALLELILIKDSIDMYYIIDGAKLADPLQRNATLFNALTFIRRTIDDSVLSSSTRFKIIVSKWDILNEVNSFNFEDNLIGYFKENLPLIFENISFAKIAARPLKSTDDIYFGYGIYELLREWIDNQNEIVPDFVSSYIPNPKRYFDMFKIIGDGE